jgi:hypothetical protein
MTRIQTSVIRVFSRDRGEYSCKSHDGNRDSWAELLYWLSDWPWVPHAPAGGAGEDFADAGAAAMHCGAARASANWKQVGLRPKLAGGNCPRAKNSHSHCCQERVFDCLTHDSSSLPISFKQTKDE